MDRTMKNDPWLKVLEERVAELEAKQMKHQEIIDKRIKEFRKWVATKDDLAILYDSEWHAKQLIKTKETFSAIWSEYMKAQSELEQYKDAMGYE